MPIVFMTTNPKPIKVDDDGRVKARTCFGPFADADAAKALIGRSLPPGIYYLIPADGSPMIEVEKPAVNLVEKPAGLPKAAAPQEPAKQD